MATLASSSFLPFVGIKVTVFATLGYAHVAVVYVAFATGDLFVLPLQWVLTVFFVVEENPCRPTVGNVARATCFRELPIMKVLMAITAGCINRLKVSLSMTGAAIDLLMLPSSLEATLSMVEERDLPAFKSTMTSVTAAIWKLSRMGIDMAETTFLHSIVFGVSTVGMTAMTRLD